MTSDRPTPAPQARNSMEACPTEVLLNIFSYLKTKDLTRCREVCWRWKNVVDADDVSWRMRCRVDFKDNYKAAHHKREEGLSWFGLYRSLSMWSKLRHATESQETFTRPSSVPESKRVNGFQLLSRGEVGVRFNYFGIFYYNIETLQRSPRENISGIIKNYVENDDVILLLMKEKGMSSYCNLHVKRKVTRPQQESTTCIPSVQSFFLTDNIVFILTLENNNNLLYTCNLSADKLERSLLMHIPVSIANIGYQNDCLYLLNWSHHEVDNAIAIYDISGPSPVRRLDIKPNLMHLLNDNEHLQDRFITLTMFPWNDITRKVSLLDLKVIKVYGEVIFAGLRSEFLHIYYVPHSKNPLDIIQTECKPIKQYNFKGGGGFTHIDVMECNDGHTVLVGMFTNIVVLKFSHYFMTIKTDSDIM